ncbi:hypothetical protein GGD83_002717 [Rhodoblastus sphagnicola]|nr:hypothetical protein [Rhodoblastus sphagnicola]
MTSHERPIVINRRTKALELLRNGAGVLSMQSDHL